MNFENLRKSFGKFGKNVQMKIENVAAILLLVVMMSLTVNLLSLTGNVYSSIADTGKTLQEIRTTLCFTATKIRESDSAGNISVVSSPYGKAILITVNDGSQDWIFYYKGGLREVLTQKGNKIVPESANLISTLDNFTISQKGNTVSIAAEKKSGSETVSESITLTLRS